MLLYTLPLQPASLDVWDKKYRLKTSKMVPIDTTLEDTYERVAKFLASVESNNQEYWKNQFLWAIVNGATPAGRIISNAGAEQYKPETSLINCVVSQTIEDSMHGILESNMKSGLTLKAGCGIGYEFSTLRPKGSFVNGAGAFTSGPLSFMDIFDSTCFTVSSAGGRRGAQMATLAIWHPDVEEYISAKRENGRLRQFNMSLLIDDEFMNAVKNDDDYQLVFPISKNEDADGHTLIRKKRMWEIDYCEKMKYILDRKSDTILCKVYKTIKASYLWDVIMKNTYDYAEPGFLLIDRINQYNNNWFCEEIRATNPCGEQPLPPNGSCLLGSINVTKFVDNAFSDNVSFDWEKYTKVVRIFTRLLDNVVDVNGLPLTEQQQEILYKRRHGMGILGVGSVLSLLNMKYGSDKSLEFVEKLMKIMAIEGYKVGIDLAKEKGAAPIFYQTTNGISNKVLWAGGEYMKQIWEECPDLKEDALKYGCRFTHHTSIAPTGTISLSLNNNVSNGIEPSFSHHYVRNIIHDGKKTKQATDVFSYEMLLYRHITGNDSIPDQFSTSENVSTYDHVNVQSAAQKWCDSAISKTINVPSDILFEEFKDIYLYAYEKGLKGCTTFRFNPDVFQGVLVTQDNLENTQYKFVTDAGEIIVANGNDIILYDGEEHTAANLFDGLKEGYYGKY